MSSAREYRRHLLRIGEASVAREQRKPAPMGLLDTALFGSLAVLVLILILLALWSRMA